MHTMLQRRKRSKMVDTVNKTTAEKLNVVPIKKRKQANDVIDSMGDNEEKFSQTCRTLRRSTKKLYNTNLANHIYLNTPQGENVLKPEWMIGKSKSFDCFDAGPFTVAEKNYPPDSKTLGEIKAKMVVGMDSDYYNMNHKNRGRCVIFNHEVFDTGFDSRIGSSLDAKRIEKTFTKLGFNVEILDNLKHNDVMFKIAELRDDNHDDNDCICIFMLTHGLSPDMIFAKDVAYNLENIWKPFTADKCTSLAGKPKLFFFQACRGNELDEGIRLYHTRANKSETDSAGTSYKLPTHADFLIAHSTVQGFYSWRNPEKGTWFIQCLCDVLDEYHETTDLLKMLTMCARRVATEYTSINDFDVTKHDQKQVPAITSMLIRDLYFTRK